MKIMHLTSGSGGELLPLLEIMCKHHTIERNCFAGAAPEGDVPTRILKKRSPRALARELKKYLTNRNFDVLHCHDPAADQVAALMGKDRSFAVVTSLTAAPEKRTRADGFVAVPELWRKLVLEGYDAGRMYPAAKCLPFPKNVDHLPRREFLRSLGLDWEDDSVIFGALGGDREAILAAFEATRREMPGVKLLLPGETVDAVTDRNSFFHAVDVHLGPDVLEAARMYCPTIVPDPEKMTELAQNARLRGQMGWEAYEAAKAESAPESVCGALEEIYRTVCSRRGKAGVMICGAYGKKNAGDDAILATIIRQLRELDPDLPITVLSHDPCRTALETGVSTIHAFDLRKTQKRLKTCKLYLSGGGTLLQNATSSRSLYYYLLSMAQAKAAGCKVMLYGCGLGPIRGDRDRRLTAKVLRKNADCIALRDGVSMELLGDLGCGDLNIHQTADPALLVETADAWKYLEDNGLDPLGKYAILVLRPWEGVEERLSAICAAMEAFCQRRELQPLLYAMEPSRDMDLTQQAAARILSAKVLPPIENAELLCGLLARMELVLSMRLHGLIFAAAQGTKIAAISYDPKVDGFMASIQAESCVSLAQVTEAALTAALERAQAPDVGILKRLAQKNTLLASEFLKS